MENLIRIGEFAKLNNMSIQTLRYYESIDLLHPYYINPETNYRYYHLLQSPIIDSIQFLKSCNLSLDDIKHLLNEETPDEKIHETLALNLDALKEQQKKIQQQINITETFLNNNMIYQKIEKFNLLNTNHFQLVTYIRTQLIPISMIYRAWSTKVI